MRRVSDKLQHEKKKEKCKWDAIRNLNQVYHKNADQEYKSTSLTSICINRIPHIRSWNNSEK